MSHTTTSVNKLLEEKFGTGSGLGADYASTREEMREQIETTQAVRDAEHEVIEAAIAYRQSVRASRSVYGVADEFAHQYFEGEQGELNAALLSVTDKLITARAAASTKEE